MFGPVRKPVLKQRILLFAVVPLRRGQLIRFVDVQTVLFLAIQHEQILVVKDQIRALIETGQNPEGFFQFERPAAGFRMAFRGLLAKRRQQQGLPSEGPCRSR